MEDFHNRCGRPNKANPHVVSYYIFRNLCLYLKKSSHFRKDIFPKDVRKYQGTKLFFPFPPAICSQHESYIKSNHTNLNLYQWRIKLQAHIYLQKAWGVISALESQMTHSQTPCCHGNLTPPPSALLSSEILPCIPSDPCLPQLPWAPHPGQAAAVGRTGTHLTLPDTSSYRKVQKTNL